MNLTYFYDTATYEDAKKVYRKKAMELHPDKNIGTDTTQLMVLLNQQWDYINNHIISYPVVDPNKPKITYQQARDKAFDWNTRIKAIQGLYEIMLHKGFKKGWVYFTYVAECELHQYTIERKDLEFMAEILGYNEGWVYHKCVELKINV